MTRETNRLRVLVVGAKGRMGRCVLDAVSEAPDLEVAGAVDLGDDLLDSIRHTRPAIAVDFTTPSAVAANLRCYIEARVHPVIGTTGMPPALLASVCTEASAIGLGGVVAPNFAIGAVLMIELAAKAARFLERAEIIEFHHVQKVDAPSGTALKTRERLRECLGGGVEVPIHSVRLPGFLAHQEVILSALGQTLTIRHDTIDRRCFMPGVLLAIRHAPTLNEIIVGLERLLDL